MRHLEVFLALSVALLATSCAQQFAALYPFPRPTPMPLPPLAPLTDGVRLIVDSQLVPGEKLADRLLLGRSSYNTSKHDNSYQAGVLWIQVNGSDKPEWYDLGLSLKTKGGAPIKAEYTERDFEDVQFNLQIVRKGVVFQRAASAKFWPGKSQPMTTGADQPQGSTIYYGKYATAQFKGSLSRIAGYIETPMIVPSPYPEPHTSTVRLEFNVPLPSEDASQSIVPTTQQ